MDGSTLGPTPGSFTATAAAGGFAVSPETGKALQNAITTALDELRQTARQLNYIKQGTPLGDSPAGQSMARHNLSVAVGDSGTGERALHDLAVALEEHQAAIDLAMAHYREQERDNTGGFQ